MMTYVRLGITHYVRRPVPTTPINSRVAWEFCACLTGRMKGWLSGGGDDEILRERTLWVFPRLHPHGWLSDAPCERAVFHFQRVPVELERFLPPRGYYRVSLSKVDCDRLRDLAGSAIEAINRPTEVLALQEQAIRSELSLMALGEVTLRPLSKTRLAEQKTESALDWYVLHMTERPRYREEVAPAVNVSPSHLRRMFYAARGESPYSAFNRLRMEKARELLRDHNLTLETIAERVGLSCTSALSRAIKAHFGITPRELRRQQQAADFAPRHGENKAMRQRC